MKQLVALLCMLVGGFVAVSGALAYAGWVPRAGVPLIPLGPIADYPVPAMVLGLGMAALGTISFLRTPQPPKPG